MDKTYSLPNPGTATDVTKAANEKVARSLPLSDQSDFEKARRGYIASIDGPIETEDGRTVMDASAFAFLDGPPADTANPSLWRQAQLNSIHGLFEVADGIYQVRGYDIALMTLIRGETGWIIVDCLISIETAKAALKLAMDHLGERPISAVLITHTHADHFGGTRGVLTDKMIADGEIPIIVPKGFTRYSVSEAVLAGNQMARRAMYQFGLLVPPGPAGYLDAGIGKANARGNRSFALPTQEISETGERLTVDGVEFVFQMASGTEAPAEFIFYLPQHKALCMAEVTCRTMHNILTLRGAEVRDSLQWSKCIDESLDLFGEEVETYFACHNWPEWGNENIREYLNEQRDIYRFIHDQTLRLANTGYTPREIAELVEEPEFMKQSFSVREYYGTLNHNLKATYQKYYGYFDGNPAHLEPHTPVEEGKRYVQAMGGSDAVLDLAWTAFEEGDYRWVATVLNHLVFAEPSNKQARAMLASTYEQLAFQSESVIWRNIYLCGAQELREGVKPLQRVGGVNEDIARAMPISDFFNLLAVKLDPSKAKSVNYVINFELTDSDETVVVTVNNQVENHKLNARENQVDLTVSLTRLTLNDIACGRSSIDDAIESGAVSVTGSVEMFKEYLGMHDTFDLWFNVIEP
ncbi:MAG: hypothetical protein CMJ96_10895, partial [Planctomycetes bacterium]|nr:hypothetical protein [Planctomycetota bacterium]